MSDFGNKEILSKNLKYYIERSGKDRRELADLWGFPYSTVSEWITGRKYPRIDRIEVMADYFGILKSDLIEDKSIDKNPLEMGALHGEMLMDAELTAMYADFRLLDEREKKIVKDLVSSLAQTKRKP